MASDTARPKVEIHLMAPLFADTLVELLEGEGYEVDVHEGEVLVAASVDIVGFVVEYVDDVVIATLAGLVAEWIRRTPLRDSFRKKDAGASISDNENTVIINVKGDGNWVEVHRSNISAPDEEE